MSLWCCGAAGGWLDRAARGLGREEEEVDAGGCPHHVSCKI